MKRPVIENGNGVVDGKLGFKADPRTAPVITEEVWYHERRRELVDPESHDVKTRAAVLKPPLDRGPRKGVLALETAKGFELRDLDRRLDDRVEIEMEKAGGRYMSCDLRQRRSGSSGEIVLAFVDVCRGQEELTVFDGETL